MPERFSKFTKNEQKQKTYNSEDSLVVTNPTTNSPACGLNAAESRVGAAQVRNGRAPLYSRATGGDKAEYAIGRVIS